MSQALYVYMGLLANLNIQDQVFLLCGQSGLVAKRKTLLENHGASVAVLENLPLPNDLTTRGREEVDGVVDGVFIVPSSDTNIAHLVDIFQVCKRLRVPINVTGRPGLCTFSLPSTFEQEPFQLAVTTNGSGCRLASRIKRTLVANLPQNITEICRNVASLRNEMKEYHEDEDADDDAEQSIQLNKLVSGTEIPNKMRWLSQMVEYYPLERLATLHLRDLEQTLQSTDRSCEKDSGQGQMVLIGAGPGSVGLLTTAALQEINAADFVLADKLVPEEVLSLVPRETPVFIARKFPGNAERAQEELMEKGLAALRNGQYVVRLKQGDPYIYGRGAEEYLFFEQHGFRPRLIAGVTSALAAPLLANIPPTHRGVADQILICTGTGRAGSLPQAPPYIPTQTTIFLMALHRIKDIVHLLIEAGWNSNVPCATIERASCPDQRIIRARLSSIASALEAEGSRPPGLLVVGNACEVVARHPAEGWIVE